MEKTKGEKIAVLEMRKHIAWYLHGFYDSARIRASIFKTQSKKEVMNILEKALI
jgi:tRNA-dihydrouridine synthase